MSRIRLDPLAPSRTVLLLVDFVNPLDFDGAEQIAASAVEAARCTAALRRRLSAQGVRTVYANDNYGLWTSDFKALWTRCAAQRGAPGRMAKLLAPARHDFVLLKSRHSAFYATPLDILLRQLKCHRLVITGIAADSCVLFSAMDAYLRDYAVCVPPDCVAAESDAERDKALEHMKRVLKADIRTSDRLRYRN